MIPRVLVVGDIMLDMYVGGKVLRISPEAPVPILKFDKEFHRLGGAANVALNLRGLEVNVDLLGIMGEDKHGSLLYNLLENHGIVPLIIIDETSITITKKRMVSSGHQLLRVDYEEPFSVQAIGAISLELKSKAFKYDVIIFSDYRKGTLDNISQLILTAKTSCPDAMIIVDPKGNDYTKYNGVDIITPNISEFELAVGVWCDENELRGKARDFLMEYDIRYILLTRSEQGMSLFSLKDDEVQAIDMPSDVRDVADVTGAGDTVIATLGHAIAHGLSIGEAALLANKAAGVVVGQRGTSQINIADISPVVSET